MNDLKAEAVSAVSGLLGRVPCLTVTSVRHDQQLGLDCRADGRIDFERGDHTYALVIEVMSNGAPRFVRSAVHQLKGYLAHAHQSRHEDPGRHLIPMLVSSYLPPESRMICTTHDVPYLDLFGNAHLAIDNVYIDQAVADRPKPETRALRSMFSPKAAAVLRVMLRSPGKAWRVADLARKANVSFGHVSNVRRALLEREWIQKSDKGVALVQPGALVKVWRENYRRPEGQRITGYTHLHGKQLDERLSGCLNPRPHHPRAIYSLNSAAQWFAPFVRDGTTNFHVDEPGLRLLRETLELDSATRGANVILRVPVDHTLFEDAVEPVRGIFCTDPIVTYLDLWNGSERDREAAEHLAGKLFSWL